MVSYFSDWEKILHVTDKKGPGQPACPKEWKKYEGGMDSNINVM
jgi:hypothetical protein